MVSGGLAPTIRDSAQWDFPWAIVAGRSMPLLGIDLLKLSLAPSLEALCFGPEFGLRLPMPKRGWKAGFGDLPVYWSLGRLPSYGIDPLAPQVTGLAVACSVLDQGSGPLLLSGRGLALTGSGRCMSWCWGRSGPVCSFVPIPKLSIGSCSLSLATRSRGVLPLCCVAAGPVRSVRPGGPFSGAACNFRPVGSSLYDLPLQCRCRCLGADLSHHVQRP